MDIPPPNPDLTTADVLEALHASGKPLHEWGQAIDGTPMLAARAGGDKQPAIFITAGAHSTETAGVHAALNLLCGLDTEHEVHVLPLRDPFGFAGVNHCLSFAAGQLMAVPDHRAALEYLQSHGDLIWHHGDMYLFKLGDIGFMWDTPRKGLGSWWDMFSCLRQLTRDDLDVLRPLLGKSVMLMNSHWGFEGDDEMQRCYHWLLSAKGESLHLNRLFGRDDAPPEVAAVDRLMQAVRPGLTCDLHEGNGEGFWKAIRKQEQHTERVFEMNEAFFGYIRARGYPVTTYEDWLNTDRTREDVNWKKSFMKPEPRLPGLFWSDGLLRDEGPNLSDYACLFGSAFGVEAPLKRPLAMRVDGTTNGIMAGIRVWEQAVERTG